jgi:DNA-binding HxlR family transcriptional regulator
MKPYGQFCPIARALEILGERWTLLILRDILYGSRRFNDIHKGVPRMSPTLLSSRLKGLVACGLVERRNDSASDSIEYVPTQAALEVKPIIEHLAVWGQRWVRNRMGDDELDVCLFMWDVRCSVERGKFPSGRSVVRFEFTDRPRLTKGKWWADKWWLIVDDEGIDLCMQDPGGDVDLYVVSDLATMTKVLMGDIPLAKAMERDLIEVHGSLALAKTFGRWLPRSSFADVERPSDTPDH